MHVALCHSMCAGAVRAHQLFLAAPGDVPLLEIVHISRFDFLAKFGFLIESTGENSQGNSEFCLIRIVKAYHYWGMIAPRWTELELIHLTKGGAGSRVLGFIALGKSRCCGSEGLNNVGMLCTTTV